MLFLREKVVLSTREGAELSPQGKAQPFFSLQKEMTPSIKYLQNVLG